MLCEGYNPSNGTYHNVTCLEHCRGSNMSNMSWRTTLCEGYNPSNGTYHNVTCLEHCRGDQHVV